MEWLDVKQSLSDCSLQGFCHQEYYVVSSATCALQPAAEIAALLMQEVSVTLSLCQVSLHVTVIFP